MEMKWAVREEGLVTQEQKYFKGFMKLRVSDSND